MTAGELGGLVLAGYVVAVLVVVAMRRSEAYLNDDTES